MLRGLAACTALAAFAVVPAAAPARTIDRTRHLWATVNVCDSQRHPDAIGVRGSMPGSGRRKERMYMRFLVQWRDPADRLWHNLRSGADSGFVAVGSARYTAREAGRVFRFEPPPAGGTQMLRGVVRFEWRIGRRVVARVSRSTTAGHRSAAGSDPKGYTAATCMLKG